MGAARGSVCQTARTVEKAAALVAAGDGVLAQDLIVAKDLVQQCHLLAAAIVEPHLLRVQASLQVDELYLSTERLEKRLELLPKDPGVRASTVDKADAWPS